MTLHSVTQNGFPRDSERCPDSLCFTNQSDAAQPAVAVGRTPRSLRSLVRPPLNGSIVRQTGHGTGCGASTEFDCAQTELWRSRVTSWDDLEAYLSTLVEKVGGTAYVLQGSGGRHLAPRPWAKDNASLFEALNRWLLAQQGVAPQDGTADPDPAPEVSRYMDALDRFKQHSAVLDSAVGADFVKRGPGKRYVHRSADLPFIAERFLSAYLLIIAFEHADVLDEGGAILALERARSAVTDMLETLPPDGGGDRALSNANRRA